MFADENLAAAWHFNHFGIFFFLRSGVISNYADYFLASDTDLLINWLYKLSVDNNYYSIGAAISLIIFIITAAVSLTVYVRSAAYKQEDTYQWSTKEENLGRVASPTISSPIFSWYSWAWFFCSHVCGWSLPRFRKAEVYMISRGSSLKLSVLTPSSRCLRMM